MPVKLVWRSGFHADKKAQMEAAQDYVDKACLDKMRPYVPVGLPRFRNSGKLRDSAKVLRRGEIGYTARFAKGDYYSYKNHKHGGNPNAQRLWFEIMKRKHLQEIKQGAAEKMGAKPK